MKKSMVMMAICSAMLMAGCVPAMASEVQWNETVESMEMVSPRMTYISRANTSLTISATGNASVVCMVKGTQDNVTRTAITAHLQRYQNGQWITVKTFSVNSNSYMTRMDESYQVSKGYTYRVSASVQAYTSSSSEGRTVVSSEVTY